MLFPEPPFEEGARVDSRRSVSLKIDEVTRLITDTGTKEVIEPDLHEGGDRGVCCNMSANARVRFVLLQDHGHRVPAQDALDPASDRLVAGIRLLIFMT